MPGLFSGTPLERPVTCEHCGKPVSGGGSGMGGCDCPRTRSGRMLLPKDQPARVHRETGGRRGKTVTIIRGLDSVASDFPSLLKRLKSALGTGGTIANDEPAAPRGGPRRDATSVSTTIELQGDHRDSVVEILQDMGYPAKAAGG